MLDTASRVQKSEIRNWKSETNPKFKTQKTPMNLPDSQELRSGILDFGLLNLFRISDFGNSNLNRGEMVRDTGFEPVTPTVSR